MKRSIESAPLSRRNSAMLFFADAMAAFASDALRSGLRQCKVRCGIVLRPFDARCASTSVEIERGSARCPRSHNHIRGVYQTTSKWLRSSAFEIPATTAS